MMLRLCYLVAVKALSKMSIAFYLLQNEPPWYKRQHSG